MPVSDTIAASITQKYSDENMRSGDHHQQITNYNYLFLLPTQNQMVLLVNICGWQASSLCINIHANSFIHIKLKVIHSKRKSCDKQNSTYTVWWENYVRKANVILCNIIFIPLLQNNWIDFNVISDWKLIMNDCGNMPVVVQNVSVFL